MYTYELLQLLEADDKKDIAPCLWDDIQRSAEKCGHPRDEAFRHCKTS